MRRWTLLLLGIVLAATGAVWTLQGLDVLKGSFMTGSTFWLWTGVACLAVGAPVAVAGLRSRPGR